jgi:phage-related tail protein
MAPESPKENGKMALLTTLASSGDSWVKLGIMLMVGISGLGNFVATTKTSDDQRNLTKQEAQEVKNEIHDIYRKVDDLHGALDEFESRQKKMLQNQGQLLQSNSDVLSQLHDLAVKLDASKGAPQ